MSTTFGGEGDRPSPCTLVVRLGPADLMTRRGGWAASVPPDPPEIPFCEKDDLVLRLLLAWFEAEAPRAPCDRSDNEAEPMESLRDKGLTPPSDPMERG